VVSVRIPPIGQLAPWIALIAWWVALSRFRRGRSWLRSTPLAVALVIATAFADASVVVASGRMAEPGGRSFALALLWIAVLLSITTFVVLRTPGEGGSRGDDPGPGDEPPEPPWWPDFERAFRDYARRPPGPRRRAKPPAGIR